MVGLAFVAALIAAPPPAAAQEKRVVAKTPLALEAGPGQRHLVLSFDGDTIHGRACPKKDCDPAGGFGVRPPASVRKAVESSSVEVVSLANGKHLALVRVPADAGRFYGVLLASTDTKSDTPVVVWSGFVGGSGKGSEVVLKRDDKSQATSFALEGRASLCGREVPTQKRRLDPTKLSLIDEPMPDPIGSLRPGATALKAATEPKPVAAHQVLNVTGGSSGDIWALSDGDRATAWAEQVPGTGARSFVSMSAPDSVSISGFDLSFDPKGIDGARAPRSLSIVTDAGVFNVTLPADAVALGGASFGVTLPKAINTKCVALVLDEAHAAKNGADKAKPGDKATKVDPAVFVSEIAARTSFDKDSLEDLARSLGAPGPEQKAREAVLLAARDAGMLAIGRVYAGLDPSARDRARRIVDATPCDQRLKVYLPFLAGPDREESDRARDRIRRCGKEAGPLLVAALAEKLPLAQRGAIAEEAALLAPQLVMGVLFKELAAAKTPEERLTFRKAIAKGALRESGARVIDAALADEAFRALPVAAKIEVVRAVGPALVGGKNGPAAFAMLAKETLEFRERYLLLPVASELARAGDEAGLAFMKAAIDSGADPRLRARGAELAFGVNKLEPRIIELMDDDKVRVREAALLSLTRSGSAMSKGLQQKLADRLKNDPWTFVRKAAVSALATAPSDVQLNATIAALVDYEESAAVRTEMVRALGLRNARPNRKVVVARAFDGKEAVEVRSAAVLALGGLCDKESVDALSELVLRGATPQFEADRKLGLAATEALAVIRPADLEARLTAVTREAAPPEIRAVAQRALKSSAAACK